MTLSPQEACRIASSTPVDNWPIEVFTNVTTFDDDFVSDFSIFGRMPLVLDGVLLVEALVRTGLCTSKGDAHRALKQKSIRVRGSVVDRPRALTRADAIHQDYVVIMRGRSKVGVVIIDDNWRPCRWRRS